MCPCAAQVKELKSELEARQQEERTARQEMDDVAAEANELFATSEKLRKERGEQATAARAGQERARAVRRAAEDLKTEATELENKDSEVRGKLQQIDKEFADHQ